MVINRSVEIFRNPRRTDWESFRTDLSGCLRVMPDKVNNFTDLEIAAKQFKDATVVACSETRPLTVMKNNRKYPGGIKTLRRKGGKFINYLT